MISLYESTDYPKRLSKRLRSNLLIVRITVVNGNAGSVSPSFDKVNTKDNKLNLLAEGFESNSY